MCACVCVCGPRNTEPRWTWPYLIREDTRNAIKSDKAGTSANLTNDWWNLCPGSDFIYVFLFVSRFDTTAFSLTHEHQVLSHKHYEHTDVTFTQIYGHTHTLTHTCTHMADPAEVMVDPLLFGLLCYFNVFCCTWGDTQAHTWQHDRGAQLPFPWERERASVCVCHRESAQKKNWREWESTCACMWCKHDRLISHQWPFKVFSIGTPDLFTWCQ